MLSTTSEGVNSSPTEIQTRWKRTFQVYVDRTTLYTKTRWLVFSVVLFLFTARIVFAQGYYISAYALGIYLLNLFIGFLTPQRDSETDDYILPVR